MAKQICEQCGNWFDVDYDDLPDDYGTDCYHLCEECISPHDDWEEEFNEDYWWEN